jgi:hypothetical protein
MKLCRQSRVASAFIALLSMLFMQLVLAGYVCPPGAATVAADATVQVSASMPPMPGCDQVDMEQPSLCHANAHAVQQSLDKHALPLVSAFVPASLTLVLHDTKFLLAAHPCDLDAALLSGAPPPLTIRHCCFRI